MVFISWQLLILSSFLKMLNGQLFTEPDRPSTGTRLFLQPFVGDGDYVPDTVVNNFTTLAAGFFADTDTNILWCQSANNGTTIGEWYFPDGTRVPTEDDSGPLHEYHAQGQVGLLRDGGILGREGLYRCVIPDENGVNQTLWVGLYRTVPYNNGDYSVTVENPMVFSLSSADSIDSDPPVFTLSFNVTGYPPSTVTCSIDGSNLRDCIDIDREVITSPYPSRVLVTVTVTTRQSGTYTCTVNTIGPNGLEQPQTVALTMDNTDGLDIIVTDSPVSVTGTRTGISQAILSWSPPVSNTPIVQGYEVFYDSSDGSSSRLSVDVGTNTTVTLTTLDPELSYSVFVVAYGGDLPSTASNTVIISEVPSLVVSVSTDPVDVNTPLIEGTYIDLVCNVSITSGVNTNITVDIEWTRNGVTINDGSDGYSISSVMMVSENYINTVRIEELAIEDNNAVYRCSASVTPSISTFIIGSNGNDSFTTTVREFVSSDVDVSISFLPSIPTGGDQFNLTCSFSVPDRLVDSPSSIAITYDNGAQMKVSEVNPDATQTDILYDGGSVYYKILTINPVKTSDGRKYYCQVAFHSSLDADLQGNRDLSVYIPSPSMSIALSPDGIIYESTLLVITCNATLLSTVVDTDVTVTVTWTGPNGIVNSNNRITVSPATSIGYNVYQSQLTFNPVDNGDNIDGQNDEGNYICEMTISSNDNLVLTSMNNITDTVTVTVPSDAAPQNFTSNPDRFSIVFTWSPPATPNGIITEYNLTVSILSTTRDNLYNTTTYPITDPSMTSMRIQGLMPYQRYNATVSARTVAGFGPEASTRGITDPDTSSAVILYTVDVPGFDLQTLPAADSSTLNVTWWPPMTPNGKISEHRIDVTTREEGNPPIIIQDDDHQTSYTRLVGELRAGVPYYITIGAVNQLGQGENVSVTAFTGPPRDNPPSPDNVMSNRSDDGTEITVSWERITLEDAGGFYNITITLDGGSRKRKAAQTEKTVPFTEPTSATFTGLEPSADYSVTAMTVVTTLNSEPLVGSTSEPITVPPNPGQEPPSSGDNTAIIAVAVAVPLAILLFGCGIIISVIVIWCKGGVSSGNDHLLSELSDVVR